MDRYEDEGLDGRLDKRSGPGLGAARPGRRGGSHRGAVAAFAFVCDEVGVFAFRADDVDYEIGPLSGGKDQGGRLSRALRAVGRRVRSPSHPLESQSEPRRDLRRPILLSHPDCCINRGTLL